MGGLLRGFMGVMIKRLKHALVLDKLAFTSQEFTKAQKRHV